MGPEYGHGLDDLLLQGILEAAMKMPARAGVSSEGSPGEGSTSKLMWLQVGFSSLQAVGLLASVPFVCWPEAALSSSPCGHLHWASHNLTTHFTKAVEREREREGGREGACARE